MARGRPRNGLFLKIHKATGVWYVINPDTRREKYFTKDRDKSQALLEQWLLDRARHAERSASSPDAKWIITPQPLSGQDLIVHTVADVFNLYLDWLHRQKKLRSYTDTKVIAKEFAKYIPLTTRLDTLSKKDFRTYRDALWEKVERDRHKRSYANRRIRVVRAAFRAAYRESDHMLNGENIKQMLEILQTRQEKDAEGASPITPNEFHAIAEADDAQWKAIMYMAMNCALGNTDIARLERKHVNLDAAMLDYSRPKAEEAVDRPRHTPLWKETVNAVRTYLKSSRSQGLLFCTVRGNAWVTCSSRGDNDELAKKFRRIVNRLELKRKGLSFYSVRHAAAEWAADAPGVDTMGVKFLLGHATPEMWGKYVTRAPDRLQNAAQAIHSQVFKDRDDSVSTVPDEAETAQG